MPVSIIRKPISTNCARLYISLLNPYLRPPAILEARIRQRMQMLRAVKMLVLGMKVHR